MAAGESSKLEKHWFVGYIFVSYIVNSPLLSRLKQSFVDVIVCGIWQKRVVIYLFCMERPLCHGQRHMVPWEKGLWVVPKKILTNPATKKIHDSVVMSCD